jgi:hypothetical protein
MHVSRLPWMTAFACLCATTTINAQVSLPFDAPQVVATSQQQIVATLDLDGDGYEDAMGWWLDGPNATNPDNGKMHGWLNDGTGRLALAWDMPFTGSSANGPIPREVIDVLDLDSDGDDDWVMGVGDRVRVYLSNGGQLPSMAIDHPVGVTLRGIVLADFDGDGKRELAFSSMDGIVMVYEILLGSGTLQWVSSLHTGLPVIVGPLVAGEFTGDTTADLLVSGARLFPCIGGLLQPMSADFGYASDPATFMFAHDVGDVDGDNDVDVVTFSVNGAGERRARILRRVSPTTLVAEPVHAGGPARILADVDDDGDLDGVCCGGGSGPPVLGENDKVSVFRVAYNDGTGQFAPSVEWAGLGSVAIADAVDLDKDGDLDLVAGRTVQYAQGPLVAPPLADPGHSYDRPPWAGDVDGDGDVDLDLTLGGYLANLGDGTFEARSLTLPAPPQGMTRFGEGYVTDWDGDGDPDLLAPLELPASWGQEAMELLVNTAPGRFESLGVVDSTFVPWAYGWRQRASSADLDGDLDLDLIVRTEPITVVRSYVYLNQGTAGYQSAGWVETAHIRALADVDGDGLLDALGAVPKAPPHANPLSWAAGHGDGTFGPWMAIAGTWVRPDKDRFAAADLDGDGDTDLGVFGPLSGELQPALVLRNQGNAVFTQEIVGYAKFEVATPPPFGVVAADIHGNGTLDLLIAPVASTPNAVDVRLLAAGGMGYLPTKTQVLLYPHPDWPSQWRVDFAVEDLDGDGDPEIIGNRMAQDTRFNGPSSGSRLQVGDGQAGQGGVTPLLGAQGPFREGHTVRLCLNGLRPGASGVLTLVGTTAPPAAISGPTGLRGLGSFAQKIPFVASGASGDPLGSGTWEHSFVVTPNLAGTTWHFEAVVTDPDALGGHSESNLLVLTYGT